MDHDSNILQLKALLGDYPNTLALKRGEVRSPNITFDFADVKTPSTSFKDVVRHLKYDVAELAIVTYLQAKAHGKPVALFPPSSSAPCRTLFSCITANVVISRPPVSRAAASASAPTP